MSDNQTDGKAKNFMGKAKEAVGDMLGNNKMKTEGQGEQVEGKTQDTVGKAQDVVTPDNKHHDDKTKP